MSVARCQAEVSSKEFVYWQAFFAMEPFGDVRADLRNGILCSLVANLLSKGPRKKAADFMPDFEVEEDREMTPEEAHAHLRRLLGRPVVQEQG